MKIVKILGGLGNQMFQFALYKSLQARHADDAVLVDLHCFRGYGKHRGFEIGSVFGADYQEASLAQVARLAYPYPNYLSWRIGSRLLPDRRTMLKEQADFTFEPTALTRPGSTYYDGYWQHEEYFLDIRSELLDIFRFPALTDDRNRRAAQMISRRESCALHIRRGDYLTDPLRKGTTGSDFALRAVQEMKARRQPDLWVVFSDDIDWCRQNLAESLGDAQTLFIDWNTGSASIHDMHLMSLCRSQIIANSSFSWWAAWLNQHADKAIIGPSRWMNLPHVVSPMPNDWIRLSF